MQTVHVPVLLKESVDALKPESGDVFLDATMGGGGHAEALLRSADVSVIAFDADPEALNRARHKLAHFVDKVSFVHSNFRNLAHHLQEGGIQKLSGALFDLGLSSDELSQSGRGFSFLGEEPLHMGFDPKQSLEAKDLLAHLSVQELTNILRTYGEEPHAYKIADGIVEARKIAPITSTKQLREVIEKSVPKAYTKRKVHPATKTFQALRIAVNDEYDALKEGLDGAWGLLQKGGRLAVISFHSGEDRIVKRFMKEKELTEEAELIFKKPLTPSKEELAINPRARSAKLRACIKII